MKIKKITTSRSELVLYLCLALFVLRDCLRVLLGDFVVSSRGWEFERYTSPLMSALGLGSIVLLIVYVLLFVNNRLPNRLRLVVYCIGFLSLAWTIHSLITIPDYSVDSLDGTAKTIWICLLGLYIGYDESSWLNIKKLIPFLATLYMTITFGYVIYIRFNGMWRQQLNEAPYWLTYSTAFWLLAYLALCNVNKTARENQRLLLLFLMNTFVVAFTISRGWLFQTFFLMSLYLTTSSSSKKYKFKLITVLFIILIIGFYVLHDELVLYLDSYIDKFQTGHSRETQYYAFFSQVDLKDLIVGKGEYASYVYKNNPNYIYIDNSFLYYAFHFGLLYSLTILLMELFEAFKVLNVPRINAERNLGYVIIMWIIALSGASVFCAGYEVSFRVLFVMILIGRAAFISDMSQSILLKASKY